MLIEPTESETLEEVDRCVVVDQLLPDRLISQLSPDSVMP
jgi:hypothetical protein